MALVFPLRDQYRAVRAWTESLCAPLATEDYVVRSMNDVSPAKWHLAHTSWFFETFVLGPYLAGYEPRDSRYAYLFNSYYVQAGERHCRAQRGLATRPTVAEVYAYRAHVDAAMERLFDRMDTGDSAARGAVEVLQLGLQHEQQHQELILTDIKHVFWMNPLRPVYKDDDVTANAVSERAPRPHVSNRMPHWCEIAEGVYEIGYAGDGFAFDNEGPRHRTYVQAAKVATRLVTNREYLAFMADGGYRRPELWLSSGWDVVRGERWEAPLYWERESPDAPWQAFTLRGTQVIDGVELDAPVCHVSFFEADAYARWKEMRLPTEAEWEVVAASVPLDATRDGYAEGGHYHPVIDDASEESSPSQLFGTVWQWTASPYVGYPGYRPVAGAIGEYNGKWMCDQWVLRGASCATPRSHARHTYRNFFPAQARWQFAGIRLAADA
jgi:ergothioneine biosynthesis protein EgtB